VTTRCATALLCAVSVGAVVFAPRGAPPGPAPRLADGTPNLGRVPGEKGIWNVPWIRTYLIRLTDDFGQPLFGRKR